MFFHINFVYIILFFLAVAVITFIKTNKSFKGYIGENLIYFFSKFFLNSEYKIYKDIYIANKNDITQIDELIVSKYGIFVIEVKNFKGWIFGSEKDKFWTQKLYKKNFKFQNPLRQNYKHISYLSDFLNLDKTNFFSLVVFTGEVDFKTKMPNNIFNGLNFIKFIKSHKEIKLSNEELNETIKLLNNISTNKKNLKQKHLSKFS